MAGAYLAAALLALPSSAARAADASAWDKGEHSAVRLIAGAPAADGARRAGVEVKLAPGWKTYWRYPGDSGVPPRFDFTGSRNVKSVTVAWPAPRRFSDDGGTVLGFVGELLLPLRVVAQDAAAPVELALRIDYAVCEKLCVPVDGTATLNLGAAASGHEAALVAAEARIPRPTTLGDGTPTIRAVSRGSDNRVTVEVAAPADMSVDLFAEGPTAEWALPVPTLDPTPAGDGARRFSFELDGLPAGARAEGAELKLTLTSPARAIEVRHKLP